MSERSADWPEIPPPKMGFLDSIFSHLNFFCSSFRQPPPRRTTPTQTHSATTRRDRDIHLKKTDEGWRPKFSKTEIEEADKSSERENVAEIIEKKVQPDERPATPRTTDLPRGDDLRWYTIAEEEERLKPGISSLHGTGK